MIENFSEFTISLALTFLYVAMIYIVAFTFIHPRFHIPKNSRFVLFLVCALHTIGLTTMLYLIESPFIRIIANALAMIVWLMWVMNKKAIDAIFLYSAAFTIVSFAQLFPFFAFSLVFVAQPRYALFALFVQLSTLLIVLGGCLTLKFHHFYTLIQNKTSLKLFALLFFFASLVLVYLPQRKTLSFLDQASLFIAFFFMLFLYKNLPSPAPPLDTFAQDDEPIPDENDSDPTLDPFTPLLTKFNLTFQEYNAKEKEIEDFLRAKLESAGVHNQLVIDVFYAGQHNKLSFDEILHLIDLQLKQAYATDDPSLPIAIYINIEKSIFTMHLSYPYEYVTAVDIVSLLNGNPPNDLHQLQQDVSSYKDEIYLGDTRAFSNFRERQSAFYFSIFIDISERRINEERVF